MPRIDDRKREYDVLGIPITSNEVDVKKAFTRLAIKYHPDQNINGIKGVDQEKKIKYQEICKAYKKTMAGLSQNFDSCSIADWNNDKSDEIFFNLLGELIQNSTKTSELYTLLSSQANSRSQFQNDNEYRCKEDVMEDDDEEAELNKLVDILKNRLQNGKSVPAGITQEKLTRLKDDFMKQKEENRMAEKNHHTPTKKPKAPSSVPVAKPKPKSKKQLQAEQRRRELEMASIAKELEEKKKKEEEKEQERRKQEKERKKQIEEEKKKVEEDQRKVQKESKKKKEREEKDRENRVVKERERVEKMKKSQEEEQRKREEEKRRKAEEKAAKQKSTKEVKADRDEKEKTQLSSKSQKQQRASAQYQAQTQQQSKYPREVPPRFLRQQQMKQNSRSTAPTSATTKDNSSDTSSGSCNNESTSSNLSNGHHHYSNNRDYSSNNGWTEIVPTVNHHHNTNNDASSNSNSRSAHLQLNNSQSEDWDQEVGGFKQATSSLLLKSDQQAVKLNNNVGVIGQQPSTQTSSWGGVPATENWDLDLRFNENNHPQQQQFESSSPHVISSLASSNVIGSEAKLNKAVKKLFSSNDVSVTNTNNTAAANVNSSAASSSTVIPDRAAASGIGIGAGNVGNNESSWGESLTGSSWDAPSTSVKQWGQTSSNHSKASSSITAPDEKIPSNFVTVEQQQSNSNRTRQQKANPSDVKNSSNGPHSVAASNHSSRSVLEQSSASVHHNNAEIMRTASPGITSWAGLDSFDAGPPPATSASFNESNSSNYIHPQTQHQKSNGTKLKNSTTTKTASTNSFNNNSSVHKSGIQKQQHSVKEQLSTNGNKATVLASVNSKVVDTNSKVSGWLQSTSPQQTEPSSSASVLWTAASASTTGGSGRVKSQEEDIGWTTVAKPSKKIVGGTTTTATSTAGSAPGTPQKQDGSNAWTNRALKQLLDMGFQREQAEKALKENNGIIESAVSDLLMKADKPPEPPSSDATLMKTQSVSSTAKTKGATSNDASPPIQEASTKNDITTNPSVTLAPQKLNRKQRRKLQQMQNSENHQLNKNSNPTSSEKPSSNVNPSDTNDGSGKSTGADNNLGTKIVHGDGLLPTPPASYRLMHPENNPASIDANQNNSADFCRTSAETTLANAPGAINQMVIRKPVPIGQEAKQNESNGAKLPIGSSRPSNQPNNLLINSQQLPPHQQHHQSNNNNDLVGNISSNINSSGDLHPPTNPVLLAQMHLQKLGLEEPRTSNFLPSSLSSSSTPPQTVTNSYIQQYLQQMNISRSSDINNTSSVAAVGSSMSTPLLATSLSSLLPQPPIPANSLSDGPQKSKLLQWTQPSSACNSEPTTPPSVDDEKDGNKNILTGIDPVSAKWGVIAAPRLSPTPAEFKPGVPWRPRGVSLSDKDGEDDILLVKQVPIEIPQSSFATKLMQKQQEELDLVAAEVSSAAKLSQYTWVLLKGFPPIMNASIIRDACQQFGTLLHFKAVPGMACVQYETVAIAKDAALQMNNSQITADVSTEQECLLVIEANLHSIQSSVSGHPLPQVPYSSMGGLWGTSVQSSQPPQASQNAFVQPPPPNFPPSQQPSNMSGFNHWGMPPPPHTNNQPMMQSSQLWGPGPGPQQPGVGSMFPGFNGAGGWLPSKPVDPLSNSIFNPSELLNYTREQGS